MQPERALVAAVLHRRPEEGGGEVTTASPPAMLRARNAALSYMATIVRRGRPSAQHRKDKVWQNLAWGTHGAPTIGQVERLLVVEDDDTIAVPLARALEREDFSVDHAATGEAALERLAAESYSLVILDIGLPGISGLEVCRRIRADHAGVGVLMLTARSSELDEVIGLDAGADDYVTKPFSLAVLTARVRALLRREPPAGGPATVDVGDLHVDLGARIAARADAELALSPKEFDLLALLAAHAGEALRREDIMSQVWDENWWGSTKTLDVHMGWLRAKLGEPPMITTVRGYGFRMDQP
jgi:DNA-binding response OmpR family regulator